MSSRIPKAGDVVSWTADDIYLLVANAEDSGVLIPINLSSMKVFTEYKKVIVGKEVELPEVLGNVEEVLKLAADLYRKRKKH